MGCAPRLPALGYTRRVWDPRPPRQLLATQGPALGAEVLLSTGRSPALSLAQLPFPRDDPRLPVQPRHQRLRARDDAGAGGGSQSQGGALKTRGKESLPARRSELLRSPLPETALSPPVSVTTQGRGRPGESKRMKQKIPYRGGRDETVGQGSAGADLGFHLRLPSTPGYGAAEKAGAAAPSSLSLLPSPLPASPALPRPPCLELRVCEAPGPGWGR